MGATQSSQLAKASIFHHNITYSVNNKSSKHDHHVDMIKPKLAEIDNKTSSVRLKSFIRFLIDNLKQIDAQIAMLTTDELTKFLMAYLQCTYKKYYHITTNNISGLSHYKTIVHIAKQYIYYSEYKFIYMPIDCVLSDNDFAHALNTEIDNILNRYKNNVTNVTQFYLQNATLLDIKLFFTNNENTGAIQLYYNKLIETIDAGIIDDRIRLYYLRLIFPNSLNPELNINDKIHITKSDGSIVNINTISHPHVVFDTLIDFDKPSTALPTYTLEDYNKQDKDIIDLYININDPESIHLYVSFFNSLREHHWDLYIREHNAVNELIMLVDSKNIDVNLEPDIFIDLRIDIDDKLNDIKVYRQHLLTYYEQVLTERLSKYIIVNIPANLKDIGILKYLINDINIHETNNQQIYDEYLSDEYGLLCGELNISYNISSNILGQLDNIHQQLLRTYVNTNVISMLESRISNISKYIRISSRAYPKDIEKRYWLYLEFLRLKHLGLQFQEHRRLMRKVKDLNINVTNIPNSDKDGGYKNKNIYLSNIILNNMSKQPQLTDVQVQQAINAKLATVINCDEVIRSGKLVIKPADLILAVKDTPPTLTDPFQYNDKVYITNIIKAFNDNLLICSTVPLRTYESDIFDIFKNAQGMLDLPEQRVAYLSVFMRQILARLCFVYMFESFTLTFNPPYPREVIYGTYVDLGDLTGSVLGLEHILDAKAIKQSYSLSLYMSAKMIDIFDIESILLNVSTLRMKFNELSKAYLKDTRDIFTTTPPSRYTFDTSEYQYCNYYHIIEDWIYYRNIRCDHIANQLGVKRWPNKGYILFSDIENEFAELRNKQKEQIIKLEDELDQLLITANNNSCNCNIEYYKPPDYDLARCEYFDYLKATIAAFKVIQSDPTITRNSQYHTELATLREGIRFIHKTYDTIKVSRALQANPIQINTVNNVINIPAFHQYIDTLINESIKTFTNKYAELNNVAQIFCRRTFTIDLSATFPLNKLNSIFKQITDIFAEIDKDAVNGYKSYIMNNVNLSKADIDKNKQEIDDINVYNNNLVSDLSITLPELKDDSNDHQSMLFSIRTWKYIIQQAFISQTSVENEKYETLIGQYNLVLPPKPMFKSTNYKDDDEIVQQVRTYRDQLQTILLNHLRPLGPGGKSVKALSATNPMGDEINIILEHMNSPVVAPPPAANIITNVNDQKTLSHELKRLNKYIVLLGGIPVDTSYAPETDVTKIINILQSHKAKAQLIYNQLIPNRINLVNQRIQALGGGNIPIQQNEKNSSYLLRLYIDLNKIYNARLTNLNQYADLFTITKVDQKIINDTTKSTDLLDIMKTCEEQDEKIKKLYDALIVETSKLELDHHKKATDYGLNPASIPQPLLTDAGGYNRPQLNAILLRLITLSRSVLDHKINLAQNANKVVDMNKTAPLYKWYFVDSIKYVDDLLATNVLSPQQTKNKTDQEKLIGSIDSSLVKINKQLNTFITREFDIDIDDTNATNNLQQEHHNLNDIQNNIKDPNIKEIPTRLTISEFRLALTRNREIHLYINDISAQIQYTILRELPITIKSITDEYIALRTLKTKSIEYITYCPPGLTIIKLNNYIDQAFIDKYNAQKKSITQIGTQIERLRTNHSISTIIKPSVTIDLSQPDDSFLQDEITKINDIDNMLIKAPNISVYFDDANLVNADVSKYLELVTIEDQILEVTSSCRLPTIKRIVPITLDNLQKELGYIQNIRTLLASNRIQITHNSTLKEILDKLIAADNFAQTNINNINAIKHTHNLNHIRIEPANIDDRLQLYNDIDGLINRNKWLNVNQTIDNAERLKQDLIRQNVEFDKIKTNIKKLQLNTYITAIDFTTTNELDGLLKDIRESRRLQQAHPSINFPLTYINDTIPNIYDNLKQQVIAQIDNYLNDANTLGNPRFIQINNIQYPPNLQLSDLLTIYRDIIHAQGVIKLVNGIIFDIPTDTAHNILNAIDQQAQDHQTRITYFTGIRRLPAFRHLAAIHTPATIAEDIAYHNHLQTIENIINTHGNYTIVINPDAHGNQVDILTALQQVTDDAAALILLENQINTKQANINFIPGQLPLAIYIHPDINQLREIDALYDRMQIAITNGAVLPATVPTMDIRVLTNNLETQAANLAAAPPPVINPAPPVVVAPPPVINPAPPVVVAPPPPAAPPPVINPAPPVINPPPALNKNDRKKLTKINNIKTNYGLIIHTENPILAQNVQVFERIQALLTAKPLLTKTNNDADGLLRDLETENQLINDNLAASKIIITTHRLKPFINRAISTGIDTTQELTALQHIDVNLNTHNTHTFVITQDTAVNVDIEIQSQVDVLNRINALKAANVVLGPIPIPVNVNSVALAAEELTFNQINQIITNNPGYTFTIPGGTSTIVLADVQNQEQDIIRDDGLITTMRNNNADLANIVRELHPNNRQLHAELLAFQSLAHVQQNAHCANVIHTNAGTNTAIQIYNMIDRYLSDSITTIKNNNVALQAIPQVPHASLITHLTEYDNFVQIEQIITANPGLNIIAGTTGVILADLQNQLIAVNHINQLNADIIVIVNNHGLGNVTRVLNPTLVQLTNEKAEFDLIDAICNTHPTYIFNIIVDTPANVLLDLQHQVNQMDPYTAEIDAIIHRYPNINAVTRPRLTLVQLIAERDEFNQIDTTLTANPALAVPAPPFTATQLLNDLTRQLNEVQQIIALLAQHHLQVTRIANPTPADITNELAELNQIINQLQGVDVSIIRTDFTIHNLLAYIRVEATIIPKLTNNNLVVTRLYQPTQVQLQGESNDLDTLIIILNALASPPVYIPKYLTINKLLTLFQLVPVPPIFNAIPGNTFVDKTRIAIDMISQLIIPINVKLANTITYNDYITAVPSKNNLNKLNDNVQYAHTIGDIYNTVDGLVINGGTIKDVNNQCIQDIKQHINVLQARVALKLSMTIKTTDSLEKYKFYKELEARLIAVDALYNAELLLTPNLDTVIPKRHIDNYEEYLYYIHYYRSNVAKPTNQLKTEIEAIVLKYRLSTPDHNRLPIFNNNHDRVDNYLRVELAHYQQYDRIMPIITAHDANLVDGFKTIYSYMISANIHTYLPFRRYDTDETVKMYKVQAETFKLKKELVDAYDAIYYRPIVLYDPTTDTNPDSLRKTTNQVIDVQTNIYIMTDFVRKFINNPPAGFIPTPGAQQADAYKEVTTYVTRLGIVNYDVQYSYGYYTNELRYLDTTPYQVVIKPITNDNNVDIPELDNMVKILNDSYDLLYNTHAVLRRALETLPPAAPGVIPVAIDADTIQGTIGQRARLIADDIALLLPVVKANNCFNNLHTSLLAELNNPEFVYSNLYIESKSIKDIPKVKANADAGHVIRINYEADLLQQYYKSIYNKFSKIYGNIFILADLPTALIDRYYVIKQEVRRMCVHVTATLMPEYNYLRSCILNHIDNQPANDVELYKYISKEIKRINSIRSNLPRVVKFRKYDPAIAVLVAPLPTAIDTTIPPFAGFINNKLIITAVTSKTMAGDWQPPPKKTKRNGLIKNFVFTRNNIAFRSDIPTFPGIPAPGAWAAGNPEILKFPSPEHHPLLAYISQDVRLLKELYDEYVATNITAINTLRMLSFYVYDLIKFVLNSDITQWIDVIESPPNPVDAKKLEAIKNDVTARCNVVLGNKFVDIIDVASFDNFINAKDPAGNYTYEVLDKLNVLFNTNNPLAGTIEHHFRFDVLNYNFYAGFDIVICLLIKAIKDLESGVAVAEYNANKVRIYDTMVYVLAHIYDILIADKNFYLHIADYVKNFQLEDKINIICNAYGYKARTLVSIKFLQEQIIPKIRIHYMLNSRKMDILQSIKPIIVNAYTDITYDRIITTNVEPTVDYLTDFLHRDKTSISLILNSILHMEDNLPLNNIAEFDTLLYNLCYAYQGIIIHDRDLLTTNGLISMKIEADTTLTNIFDIHKAISDKLDATHVVYSARYIISDDVTRNYIKIPYNFTDVNVTHLYENTNIKIYYYLHYACCVQIKTTINNIPPPLPHRAEMDQTKFVYKNFINLLTQVNEIKYWDSLKYKLYPKYIEESFSDKNAFTYFIKFGAMHRLTSILTTAVGHPIQIDDIDVIPTAGALAAEFVTLSTHNNVTKQFDTERLFVDTTDNSYKPYALPSTKLMRTVQKIINNRASYLDRLPSSTAYKNIHLETERKINELIRLMDSDDLIDKYKGVILAIQINKEYFSILNSDITAMIKYKELKQTPIEERPKKLTEKYDSLILSLLKNEGTDLHPPNITNILRKHGPHEFIPPPLLPRRNNYYITEILNSYIYGYKPNLSEL